MRQQQVLRSGPLRQLIYYVYKLYKRTQALADTPATSNLSEIGTWQAKAKPKAKAKEAKTTPAATPAPVAKVPPPPAAAKVPPAMAKVPPPVAAVPSAAAKALPAAKMPPPTAAVKVPPSVVKGSWEAILPCYGQIEFWDLKWWRVVCHLTIYNKRIRSYAVDFDEGW